MAKSKIADSEEIIEADMKDNKESDLTIEDSFGKLDEIIANMESGKCTLNENFALYKEGLKIVEECQNKLERVEKEIIILDESSGKDDED